jgi:hypothetical protein
MSELILDERTECGSEDGNPASRDKRPTRTAGPLGCRLRTVLFVSAVATGLLPGAMPAAEPPADKAHKLTTVSLRKMANSLHAVIAADRQAYIESVVEPWATNEVRRPAGPPAHARMLQQAAQHIQQRGAEFSYTLRSLWPIQAGNGPQTETEQQGLETVAKQPTQPFYTEEELGGRSYFTAIYADLATRSSCVSCHNQHPRSPKKDFKVGEVMGAIVVRVPLEF